MNYRIKMIILKPDALYYSDSVSADIEIVPEVVEEALEKGMGEWSRRAISKELGNAFLNAIQIRSEITK